MRHFHGSTQSSEILNFLSYGSMDIQPKSGKHIHQLNSKPDEEYCRMVWNPLPSDEEKLAMSM